MATGSPVLLNGSDDPFYDSWSLGIDSLCLSDIPLTGNLTLDGSLYDATDMLGCGSVFDEFKDGLLRYRNPATVVVVSLYGLVFVLALIGNLVSLIVLLSRKYSRCATDYFLINMAVSDLLVALVCIPVAVAQNVYGAWIFGAFMCKASPYLQGVAVTSSVWSIACLSLDRYIAIQHPLLARHIQSQYIKTAIAGIWIISFAVTIPITMVRDLHTFDLVPTDPIYFCNEKWENHILHTLYAIFLLVFIYVIPGVMMTVMYLVMGRKLWRSTGSLKRTASKTSISLRLISERKRVARMCVIVAVIFTVCWLPYYILNTYFDIINPNETQINVGGLYFALLLGHTNCAVNPILYCYMGKRFRIQLVHTLRECCGHRNNSTDSEKGQPWNPHSKIHREKSRANSKPLLSPAAVGNGDASHSDVTECNSRV